MKRLIIFIISVLVILGLAYEIAHADIYGSSLVGWYTLDSSYISGTSVTDNSGNGNTGTTHNSPTQAVGIIGQSILFVKTSSQYVTIADASVQRPNNITVCAWVNFASLPANNSYFSIVSKAYSGPPWTSPYVAYLLRAENISNNRYIEFDVGNGTSYSNDRTSFTPVVHKWYDFCMTYDGTHKLDYVNAVLKSTDNASQITGNIGYGTSHATVIGADIGASPAQDYFDGSIDDVRIYNRALSGAEVQQLYYQSLARHSSNPL